MDYGVSDTGGGSRQYRAIKILLSGDDPVIAQLRPGLSVTATVDTRTKPPESAETLVPPDVRPAGSRSSGRR